MRNTSARWAAALVAAGSLSCGGQGIQPETPTTGDHPDAPQACVAARDPLNPMIVEWPAMSRTDLDSVSRRGIVVVSYVGCVMKVLANCTAQGSYGFEAVTPAGDTLSIEDESKLYAELPLGVASLKGELQQGKKLELSYVAVGQRVANKPPATLSGECRGATHWVKTMTVGAYALDVLAASRVGGGAEVGGVQGGGEQSAKRSRRGGSGDVEGCRNGTAAGESCNAILKLGLAELAAAGMESAGFGEGLGAVASVPVIQPLQEFGGAVGGIRDVNVALLQLLQAAKRTDKDSSRSPEAKAAAWATLAGYAGNNPYKASAEERNAAWVRVAEAEARRREQVARVCAEYQKDNAKLAQLLALDDDVVSARQKEAYKREFARAYDPWRNDIRPCLGQADVAAERARVESLRCGSGRYAVLEPGTSGDAKDGSGLVRDTRTGLTWMRHVYTTSGLTQAAAQGYCQRKGMRLPTKDEALGIAESNRETCAFPESWHTWTSTSAGSGQAWGVSHHGYTFASDVGSVNSVVLCVR